ncbi:MAG TPA: glycosyltransferase [Pyrinomonadaceae bacterium]|jgi:glycosyltransferase involved in cell wall biosynthesis
MSAHPKVSICIPSYNHARYLPAALESALSQTYKDFEMIVVDDGSTDESLLIAESFAARYPAHIRVLTHPERGHRGIAETANLAKRAARGEYWSGLCSDDVWYPDKLEQQVAFMEANPRVGLVYGLAQAVDEQGEQLPQVNGWSISHEPDTLSRLLQENPIPAATALVRFECLKRAGFEDDLVYSDWEWWIRILAHSELGFIPRPLVMYRIHAYNTSVGLRHAAHFQHILAMLLALKAKAANIGGRFGTRQRAMLELQLSYLHYFTGDEPQAAFNLSAAFEVDSSLASDIEYLSAWLHSRWVEIKRSQIKEPRPAEDFKTWTIARLSSHLGGPFARKLSKRVEGKRFAAAAFESYSSDMSRVRQMALNCLRTDPRWLSDRALMSILTESLVGPRLTAQMRQLKKQLSSSE